MGRNILLICFLVLTCLPIHAGGVGYINYEEVVANYQYAKNSMREIEAKGDEIQRYLSNKEQEFNKLESPLQKKKFEETVQAELKTKEVAFNDFRNKREEQVYQKIHAVSEKIRLEKGLDAVLDARSVFSGGVDITKDLIIKLNESK